VPNAVYQTHNREEVVRILMQALNEMGYTSSARFLSEESGYEVESPRIVHFRNAIIEGQWQKAEEILFGTYDDDQDEGSGGPINENSDGLVLAEGADRDQMLFWIRKQKFVELLFQRNLAQALMVLRQELTPLNHDIQQLHYLSGLLMCPEEELHYQIDFLGPPEEQRERLLQNLTSAIAPSVMIRDHRLSELLDQVKKAQINDCLYHNTSVSPSLYSDHHCERENFPLRTWMELSEHSGEVWYLQFSHDGTKLATASSDKSVIIYETASFQVLHRLTRHDKPVTYLTWSPDDTKIISCSMDKQARVWDVAGGFITMHVDHQTPDDTHLSAAAWHPNSDSFITSSFDRKTPLCHWSIDPHHDLHLLHKWDEGLRLADCAITRDGKRVLAIDSEQCLYVFDFHTYEEEYRIPFPAKLTSLTLSNDCKSALLNLCSGEVDLVDIASGDIIRQFEGQKQGNFIIRSTFGGAAENFVLSGSEGMLTMSNLISGTNPL
jgi:WD repeat-containing protein 26